MKTLRSSHSHTERRGAALLLALLLLIVLVAITIQISVSTSTDARTARNDLALGAMDDAIESALLQEYESLRSDGEAASSGGAAGSTGAPQSPTAPATGSPANGASPAGAQADASGCDSRRDDWATVQRTEINEIRLRIFVQDEDSKYNVMNMLNPDEKEAQAAFDRVVRILDLCREGSRDYDIDPRTADEMAKAMRDYLIKRRESKIPRPALLTDPEDKNVADQGFPLTLEEFAAIPPFEEHHFRDLRDADGHVVHSIGTFLTVWSSVGRAQDVVPQAVAAANATAQKGSSGSKNTPGQKSAKPGTTATTGASASASSSTSTAGKSGTSGTSGGAPQGTASGTSSGASGSTTGANGQATGANGANGAGAAGGANGGGSSTSNTTGGWAVNVNTAPAAVLKGLFDDREVHPRLWDKVIEYRNLEEEEDKTKEAEKTQAEKDKEVQYDEYGQPILKRRIFETIGELSEVEGFKDLPTDEQTKINGLLTTQSQVFSIYVVARRATGVQADQAAALGAEEMRKQEETAGDTLVRVVRCVVWRHKVDDEVVLTPIVRWQTLDYLPYEVLDFPPDER